MPTVKVLSHHRTLRCREGCNLLALLQAQGIAPDAPCSGQGKCGKCRIEILREGQWSSALACRTRVLSDLEISVPRSAPLQILASGQARAYAFEPPFPGFSAAVDLGSTSLVCSILEPGKGAVVATANAQNPQSAYGADVISRIRYQQQHAHGPLTPLIRSAVSDLILEAGAAAGISGEDIRFLTLVGNPCMEQILLGMPLTNLASVPFGPCIHSSSLVPAKDYLPRFPNARFLILPEISGYVGADTLGCLVSMPERFFRETSLLVDIGTNGEMVLSHGGQLYACSTAAGPALEGAGIRMGMRGAPGAIDHIRSRGREPEVSVIGGLPPTGICGSGLIDGAAFLLDQGLLNRRGRLAGPEAHQRLREADGIRNFYFTDTVCVTQEDIRALQLAKGAIAAGIELMLKHCGLTEKDLDSIYLAGAFGSYLDIPSACRIGLLPEARQILQAGNAASSGAIALAASRQALALPDQLVRRIQVLELAEQPDFRRIFARNMNFKESCVIP